MESSIIGERNMRVISDFFIHCIIEKHKKFAKESFTIIMRYMNTTITITIIVVSILALYATFYAYLYRKIQYEEQKIVKLFIEKISKIPAIIEVMRPMVIDEVAFHDITELHSHAMIYRYDTIYDLLEHNARIEHEFSFLMKLSMQIPKLQKDKYFVYIRWFIMQYERDMRKNFSKVNMVIEKWNRFITIKNSTGIGIILPGSKKEAIR